jgi:hypothetical protein
LYREEEAFAALSGMKKRCPYFLCMYYTVFMNIETLSASWKFSPVRPQFTIKVY